MCRWRSIWIWWFVSSWVLWGCAAAQRKSADQPSEQSAKPSAYHEPSGATVDLSAENVRRRAMKTAELLAAQLLEEGKFIYRFDLNPERRHPEKYNILRHSGSLMALSQWGAMVGDESFQAKVSSGMQFLKRCCNVPLQVGALSSDLSAEKMSAIASTTNLNGSDKPPVAKLGGTGLALVAAAWARQIHADAAFSLAELQSLGKFLLAMQTDDGQFVAKFRLDTMAVDDSWRSLYYPGEAALGLVLLYGQDNDETWMFAANRALLALEKGRRGKSYIPHDHWALIAIEELLAHKSHLSSEDIARHLSHVAQLVQAIVSQQRTGASVPMLDGAFDAYGKTTPVATRVEGLVAAYRTMVKHSVGENELKTQAYDAIERGVRFLLRAQVSNGPYAGAIPRAIRPMDDSVDNSVDDASAFNRRLTEVRIDYLQHALSAMIGYLTLIPAA